MKIHEPFQYIGEVKVRLIVKDKIIEISGHNSGTAFLQKAFSKFLTNNFSTSDIPALLDLRLSGTSLLNQNIPLSGSNYQLDESEQRWQAAFTAVISYDTLSNHSQLNANPSLYLKTAYNSFDSSSSLQDLAFIEIDKDIINNIQPGIQILIEWYMYLNI